MSEITRHFTHWTVIKEETGKVNSLGNYVPAGLHKCQLCQTYDDPRRARIQLENGKSINLCWTCASPYLEELLSVVFDPEEIDPNNDQGALAYPRNPYSEKSESSQLPANHPKVLQEKAQANAAPINLLTHQDVSGLGDSSQE